MSEYSEMYERKNVEYSWITGVATIFFAWLAQEILERKFNMAPIIRRTRSLGKQVAMQNASPYKNYYINKRLTKQLDHSGRFRIQTRGTIYYIKAVWCALLFLFLIVIAAHSDFYYQHFIVLNPQTVNYLPYQQVAASSIAFYSWEVVANRYAALNLSVLVHHWLTVAASLAILMGVYTPFATWYGICTVAMAFPTFFALGFRSVDSVDHPIAARKCFKVAIVWYVIMIVVDFGGQIFLMINGAITGKIPWINLVIMIFVMCGWAHDDYQLTRALYDFSQQGYEDNQLVRKQNSQSQRKKYILGGRELFAMGVMNDLGMSIETSHTANTKTKDELPKIIDQKMSAIAEQKSNDSLVDSAYLTHGKSIQSADMRLKISAVTSSNQNSDQIDEHKAEDSPQLGPRLGSKFGADGNITPTPLMSPAHLVPAVPLGSSASVVTANTAINAQNPMSFIEADAAKDATKVVVMITPRQLPGSPASSELTALNYNATTEQSGNTQENEMNGRVFSHRL